jgi:GT2 family glycosyltransferase
MRIPATVAVLIPSYRRPDSLLDCLAGLAAQQRRPDDVIIAVRPDDVATHDALGARLADGLVWRIVLAPPPGIVAARNATLAAAAAFDIWAFCDDDTIARPDWIGRILEHFQADPSLGGLGGRDRCFDGTAFDDRRRDVVGQIQWYGRTIGNHHLGHGAPRRVQFLKGANMSFRAEAVEGIVFDARLRGRGMQAHEDFGFSVAVAKRGWKIAYDPAVLVDHYAYRPEQARAYVATRGLPDALQYYDSSFNYAMVLWESLSFVGRLGYLLWGLLIGNRSYPGLAQAIRLTREYGFVSWRRFFLCQRAHVAMYLCAVAQCLGPGTPAVRKSG